jgi:hypothetical protein
MKFRLAQMDRTQPLFAESYIDYSGSRSPPSDRSPYGFTLTYSARYALGWAGVPLHRFKRRNYSCCQSLSGEHLKTGISAMIFASLLGKRM